MTEPATIEIEPAGGGLVQVDVSNQASPLPYVSLRVESYVNYDTAPVVLDAGEARQIGEALIAAANGVDQTRQPTPPHEVWG